MNALDDLYQTLKTLLATIEAGKGQTEDGTTLVELLARLETQGKRLEGQAPPLLMHYLERRSYTKALDFLEGRDEADAAGE